MSFKSGISPKLHYEYAFDFWETSTSYYLVSVVLRETLWNLLSVLRQPVPVSIALLQVKLLLDNFERFLLADVCELSHQVSIVSELNFPSHLYLLHLVQKINLIL